MKRESTVLRPGSAKPATTRRSRTQASDSVCAAATDVARRAALDAAGGEDEVGEYLGCQPEGDRVVTHYFASLLPGYVGWRWAVTVARATRQRSATVDEVVLLPGSDALLAPQWVPWSERLRPGDLGVGDILPTPSDDDRLVPGYVDSGDPAVEEMLWELGLGRPRVLSRAGRDDAVDRWYHGEGGPDTPIARGAPGRCASCGFYLPLAGSLRVAFGACGNAYAPSDGRVVSAEHGCGAHSEAMVEPATADPLPAVVYDDAVVEPVGLAGAAQGPGEPSASVDPADPVDPDGPADPDGSADLDGSVSPSPGTGGRTRRRRRG